MEVFKKLLILVLFLPSICFSEKRDKEFSSCWKAKYNNADLLTKINLNTDRYWQRLHHRHEIKKNYSTCEYEPHAPFYEPKSYIKCNIYNKKSVLNAWLIERELKDKGIEDVDQNTCEKNYFLYFNK